MNDRMDPLARADALEKRLRDVKDRLRQVQQGMTPQLDALRRQLLEEETQLKAELIRIEFPRREAFFDDIESLRNGERTGMPSSSVEEECDFVIDLSHLALSAHRPGLEAALLLAIHEKAKDIRSIFFGLHVTYDYPLDAALLPSLEALQSTATRLGQALAALPSLTTVLVHFSTFDVTLPQITECLSVIFGLCRHYRRLIIDLPESDEHGLELFMGRGSRFHEYDGPLDVEIYAHGIDTLRPLLSSLCALPQLSSVSIKRKYEESVVTLETAQDATLLQAVIGKRTLSRASINFFILKTKWRSTLSWVDLLGLVSAT